MALWLKQSTAVDIKVGPFLDSADANTVEGSLTITQPDIRLAKNGGAFAQKSAAQTLSHEENGWYEVALSTTDTDTLGILTLVIHESGALQVWEKYMVVPANVYDSIIGGSDVLDASVTQWLGQAVAAVTNNGVPEVDVTHVGGSAVSASSGLLNANVTQISGDSAAADNAETAFDGGAYNVGGGSIVAASVTGAVGSVTGAVGSVTGAVGSVAAGGITASSIATDAIDADALKADAIAEIVTAVLTTAMTEAYSTDGGTKTLAQALYEICALLVEASRSGTTITYRKVDGATTAMTATINDAAEPSSITRAS